MPPIGVAPQNTIAIVNRTSLMSDTDGQLITSAIGTLLPQFCKDWGIPSVTCSFIGKVKQTTTPLQVIVLDNPDISGAFGYHDLNKVPQAKVFVKPVLDYKGGILSATSSALPSVAQVISHEIFEMITDLRCNVWWMLPDQMTLYAAEVTDPVQGNIINVKMNNKIISISDWILPSWSDPSATKGPQNHLNTLKAPFEIAKGGYVVYLQAGNYGQKFGSQINMMNQQGAKEKVSSLMASRKPRT